MTDDSNGVMLFSTPGMLTLERVDREKGIIRISVGWGVLMNFIEEVRKTERDEKIRELRGKIRGLESEINALLSGECQLKCRCSDGEAL